MLPVILIVVSAFAQSSLAETSTVPHESKDLELENLKTELSLRFGPVADLDIARLENGVISWTILTDGGIYDIIRGQWNPTKDEANSIGLFKGCRMTRTGFACEEGIDGIQKELWCPPGAYFDPEVEACIKVKTDVGPTEAEAKGRSRRSLTLYAASRIARRFTPCRKGLRRSWRTGRCILRRG